MVAPNVGLIWARTNRWEQTLVTNEDDFESSYRRFDSFEEGKESPRKAGRTVKLAVTIIKGKELSAMQSNSC